MKKYLIFSAPAFFLSLLLFFLPVFGQKTGQSDPLVLEEKWEYDIGYYEWKDNIIKAGNSYIFSGYTRTDQSLKESYGYTTAISQYHGDVLWQETFPPPNSGRVRLAKHPYYDKKFFQHVYVGKDSANLLRLVNEDQSLDWEVKISPNSPGHDYMVDMETDPNKSYVVLAGTGSSAQLEFYDFSGQWLGRTPIWFGKYISTNNIAIMENGDILAGGMLYKNGEYSNVTAGANLLQYNPQDSVWESVFTDEVPDAEAWVAKDSRDQNSFYIIVQKITQAGYDTLTVKKFTATPAGWQIQWQKGVKKDSILLSVMNVIPYPRGGISILAAQQTFVNGTKCLVYTLDENGNLAWEEDSRKEIPKDGFYLQDRLILISAKNLPPDGGDPLVTVNLVRDLETAIKTTPPHLYSLKQNFPNPFNGQTTVKFSHNYPGLVKWELFNIRGQKMFSKEEFFPAGKNKIVIDASGLPSGTYIFKLRTRKFSGTKKLVLLK